MKRQALILAMSFLIAPLVGHAEAIPGKKAPAFSVKNVDGETKTLESYKGKYLVLEWFNKDCPYVKKHYDSGNMQKLQAQYGGKDNVEWVTVNSSAQGKQGHQTAEQTKAEMKTNKSKATTLLLDESGTMGKAYGAKTTPHMYVINPEGQVIYAGAIDDNDSANPKVIPESKNFVVAALDSAMKKEKVAVTSHKPYGCSVKYQ